MAVVLLQTLACLLLLSAFFNQEVAAADIGVCYGLLGDNLPPPNEVVELFTRYNITKMRLFSPTAPVLDVLRGRSFEVAVGVPNEILAALSAGGRDAVEKWFAEAIELYSFDVHLTHIVVGNEVIPGELGRYVLPVMESLRSVLDGRGHVSTKVTTAVAGNALSVSYPPSSGHFSEEAAKDIKGVLGFLSTHGQPLMVNVYPYFAYASNPADIKLEYAQFTATSPVVQDRGLSYFNLFDAMVDAFLWAMEGAGGAGVDVIVSESGWPSAGNGQFTSPELAATYNKNFKEHIESNKGTPKRPGVGIEGFIFAMFNENQKPAGVEQNFGLFYPNMEPVYSLF